MSLRTAADLTGQRFERLVALRPAQKDRFGKWEWWVRCDCGTEKTVGAAELKKGATQSCGCLWRERVVKNNYPNRDGGTYFTGLPCKRGHISRRRVSGKTCIACANEQSKARAKAAPKIYANYHLNHRRNNPTLAIWRSARSRAKKRHLDFNIELGDIAIPAACPCCGRQLKIGNNKASADSASLDRIDSSRGYIKGNIAVICWRCNSLKSNAEATELLKISEWMKGLSAGPV